jgi:5-methylthioadenosine/S-adenosylhomocysteine deaminase
MTTTDSEHHVRKKECDLVISNCWLLIPDFSVREKMGIAIDGNRIIAIDSTAVLENKYRPKSIFDATNKLAIPGLIDAHTHTVQELLRGGVVDERPMIWARILLPYEDKLSPEIIYWAAKMTCMEMIKAGITTFADNGSREMEPVVQVVGETGMRAVISRMTRDFGQEVVASMKETTAQAISRSEDLYKKYHGNANGRIQIAFSITNPMASTPELLDGVKEKADEYKTIIHCHLAEHHREVDSVLATRGVRPVEYFHQHGLLSPNLLAAHSVQLTDREIRLMAECGVKPVICPTANLTNHGFPKVTQMLAQGMVVSAATDGTASGLIDSFHIIRLLKYVCQAYYGLPVSDFASLQLKEAFRMLLENPANALQLGKEIGSLEVGKKADIVLLNWMQPHLFPTRNIFQTLVMAASSHDVWDVFIDGELLLKERQFVRIDEQETMRKAEEQLKTLIGIAQ